MHGSTASVDSQPSHFGATLRDARLAVVLLHGRTQSPQTMFDQVVVPLGLHDIAYLAPAVPGNSWYPARFMEPISANEPALGLALARLCALSEGLTQQGFGPEHQVLMGFSQGACLACEFVWRRAERFAALVGFTGGLIGPAGTTWPAAVSRFGDMPVLLTGRREDPWVPLERMLQTSHAFRAAGAHVTQHSWPGSEHEVADGEIVLARKLLSPPLEAARRGRLQTIRVGCAERE